MPIYLYEHPETSEQKEVVQRMTEAHEYSEDGIKWKRVFVIPQASIDVLDNVDPFNKQQFMDKTKSMRNITQGEMWDLSAELSRKRTKKMGKDPVKEGTVKDYKRKTGLDHPQA